MRSSVLWVVIAFLLGASLFGIYKSLELLKKNGDLSRTVEGLKLSLVTTQAFLNETKESLRESQINNAKLEGEMNDLNSKLAEKEKAVQEYRRNISELSRKLAEAAEVNESLAVKNKEAGDQLIRLEFENGEMKKKLSSVQELRKAIKELKIKMREAKKNKRPAHAEKKQVLTLPKEITEAVLRGNQGYFVKDGKSTFEAVDIKVLPAESKNL